MMKKEQYERAEYERLELEVIRFETEDVIMTSVMRLLEYEDTILKPQ